MKAKDNKAVDLANGPILKTLIKLALPAMAAQVINMLYNMVDRMYVGGIENVGTKALAGLGVCFPVLMIVSAFAALMGVGGASLASIRLGEGNRDGAERILNNAALLLALFSVVITVVITVFSRPILIAFGAPTDSLEYANQYLRIYGFGTVFVLFSLGLNYYISAQGKPITSMLTVAIGAVLNIALDPLFIYALNMGVKGAALATIIAQGASCVWVVIFFLSSRTKLRLRLSLFKPNKTVILSMLALGVTPFIMNATESAVQIVFNIQIRAYTNENVDYTAAMTVMLSVMQMITLPLNGLGAGAQPLIGYNYGAGNSNRVRQSVKYLSIVAIVLCSIVWVLSLSYPPMFAAIFSASAEVTQIIDTYMPVFMMGTVMFFAQFAFQNAFLALGQAKISMFLALLRKVILLIPLAFLLPLAMGTRGIFMAEGIADLVAGTVTALAFIFSFNKILKKREAVVGAKNSAADSANNYAANEVTNGAKNSVADSANNCAANEVANESDATDEKSKDC